jgi:hypothetical protein
VANPGAIAIRVERDEGQRCVPGALLELSRSGVRLRVHEPIRHGERIAVALEANGINLRIETEALVCWTQPAQREGWLLCCAFSKSLEDEVISELAVRSIVNRRTESRREISFPADARSELNAEFSAVQVVNCSPYGFGGLASCHLASPGQRLMLRIPAAATEVPRLVRAKVTWSRQVDQGYALGGAFLTREDCAQVREMISPNSRQQWLKRLRRHRPTRWRMVAGGVFLMLLMQATAMLLEHPDSLRASMEWAQPWVDSVHGYVASLAG